MFSFFKKSPAPENQRDFALLEADMHAHWLPGIDDGAPDLNTSLDLLRALKELGYRKLFATPHVMSDFYPNTRDTILRKRDEVQEAAQELGLELELDTAAEYYIDEQFEALYKKEPLLVLPGNQVLVEMSFHQIYPNLHQVLFDLQMKGYRIIMAHPERYPYLQTKDDYERLTHIGCKMQVNLLSLSGYYGKPIQAAAKKLLEWDMIDYLGTDMHHERHVESLKKGVGHELTQKALQHNSLKNKSL